MLVTEHGKLLGKMLENRYHNLEQEPTLNELFGSDHWPVFIGKYIMYEIIILDKLAHCTEFQPKLSLSENCIVACSSAKMTILALCERACNGQVSVNELKVIETNLNRTVELFQACLSEKGKELIDSEVTQLISAIKDRKEEYDTFLHYQSMLKQLSQHISLNISGNWTSLYIV